MAYKHFPDWISGFALTILDEYENNIFNDMENSIDELEFEPKSGTTTGTEIFFKDKTFVVKRIDLYVNKSENKASFQVVIIV